MKELTVEDLKNEAKKFSLREKTHQESSIDFQLTASIVDGIDRFL